jgi:hypothetical protein
MVRQQLFVNGVSEYDQSFNPPTTYNQIQLAQKGKDFGPQTVRMVVTDDRGQDTETTDSWSAAPSTPSITHLAGAIVPVPVNFASLIVSAPDQGATSPVDRLGKFDLRVKGLAGDKVRILVLDDKRQIYNAIQTLPGPVTITLPSTPATSAPAARPATAAIQSLSVRGQVVDELGRPVAAANIVIPNIGSADTDSSGAFQISSPQLKMGETFQVQGGGGKGFLLGSCISSVSSTYTLTTEPITIRVLRGASRLLDCPASGSQSQPTQNPPLLNQPAQSQPPQNQPPQNQAVQSGPQQTAPNAPANPSARTLVSPDRNFVAEIDGSEQLLIRNAKSGDVLLNLGRISSSSVLAWSPDGRHLAWTFDTVIMICEIASAKISAKLSGHSAQIRAIAWSPDGKILASAADDKTVRLWDAASGRELRTLVARATMRAVSWSPDGKQIICTYDDGTTSTWDVATGAAAPPPPGNLNVVVQ